MESDYKEVNAQLQDSVKEEMTAIDAYRRRADYARRAGFIKVADLYDHIRKEEEAHSKKFLQASHELHYKP